MEAKKKKRSGPGCLVHPRMKGTVTWDNIFKQDDARSWRAAPNVEFQQAIFDAPAQPVDPRP